MDAILSRRSIRKYTDKPVSDELLQAILEAGMAAPSAGDERPWHFLIITDRDALLEIARVHPYAHMLKQAPMAVLLCADMTLRKYDDFWVQDCAASAENILIEANEQGLGACWVGVYPEQDRVDALTEMYQLPENVIPFALISLGHPAEQKPPAQRFNDLRVHRDKW